MAAGCTTSGREDSTPAGTRTEYVIRGGAVPDEFASATATVQAVFVENTDDMGPCYPETLEGPYKPTITPLGTPRGECERSEALDVEFAELETRTFEPTVPEGTAGHALIATEVTATDTDGNEVTAIKNTGGARLLEVESPPEGPYGVELRVETADNGADYEYWFVPERFDPE